MALNQLVRRGLIEWIDFGNTISYSGSGSSVSNLGSSGIVGTIYGTPAPYFSKVSSGYLVLSGSNTFTSASQYYKANSNSALPALNNFSMGVIFRTTDTANQKYIWQMLQSSPVDYMGVFTNYVSTGSLTYNFRPATGLNPIISVNAANYCDGNWHSYFVTRTIVSSNEVIKTYVDGVLANTYNGVGTANVSGTAPLALGVNGTSTTFAGCISSGCYYNVTLTDEEVLINHQYMTKRLLNNSLTMRGLVDWWNFSNNLSYTGGSNAYDLVNTNTLSLNGSPTYTSGKNGYFSFDGTSQYLEGNAGYVNPSSGDFTMGTWFRTSATFSASNVSSIAGCSSTANNPRITLTLGNGNTGNENKLVYTIIDNGSTNTNYITTNDYNDGNWHYATLVKSGSTMAAYLDGVQLTAKTGVGTITLSSYNFIIGKFGGTIPRYFSGDVSDCHYNNVALTASEILYNYQYLKNKL